MSSWGTNELEVGSWDVWELILIFKIFSIIWGNDYVHCRTVLGWVVCLSQSLSKLIPSVMLKAMGLSFFKILKIECRLEINWTTSSEMLTKIDCIFFSWLALVHYISYWNLVPANFLPAILPLRYWRKGMFSMS